MAAGESTDRQQERGYFEGREFRLPLEKGVGPANILHLPTVQAYIIGEDCHLL